MSNIFLQKYLRIQLLQNYEQLKNENKNTIDNEENLKRESIH